MRFGTWNVGGWGERWRVVAGAMLIAALALLSAGASAQVVAPQDEGRQDAPPKRLVIRFLTASDFPPFNYLEEDGTLAGFNVDIANLICLELSVTCDVKARPWEDLVAALGRGEADALVASMRISPRMLEFVDFSDRYYYTPARFAARAGARLTATPEGLEAKRVAVIKGTAHEAYLMAYFRDTLIDVHANADQARQALIDGKVDAVFDDGFSLGFWVKGTASKGCCALIGGPFADPAYFGEGIGIAVKKGDRDLVAQINLALRKARESGRYEELFLRYFPVRIY